MVLIISTTIIVLYTIAMSLVSINCTHKGQRSVINFLRAGWVVFALATGVMLVSIPTMMVSARYSYDKTARIDDSVTAKTLYDRGYVIVSRHPTDPTLYNIRELKGSMKSIK